jgi:hypothetical protein
VDMIWLAPCYESPQADMGYDISKWVLNSSILCPSSALCGLLGPAPRSSLLPPRSSVRGETSILRPIRIEE